MRIGPLALVLAAGLGTGLGLGWFLWERAPDRVATALRLLEERCVPYVLGGEAFASDGLVRVGSPTGQLWVEPRSRISVHLLRRHCGVTDALAPFGDEERARFVAGAEALGLRLLPGSTAGTPEGGGAWPIFRVIAAGEPGAAEAVLILSRHATDGDPWVGQTIATLRRAREAGAAEGG